MWGQPGEFFEAWQKPDGSFLPIKYSHPSDALDYVGGNPRGDATVVLWRRGWNRVTSGMTNEGKTIYVQNEFSIPNDKQKSELINKAQELDYVEVIYIGSDDGRPRTIWSKRDTLQENEEPTAERKATSWLTSGGMFIPIRNHHAYALRITGNDPNPESLLWKKGWQRVTYYSRGTLYVENHYMLPNEFQKAKLIDLVKELGFNELVYDNGKSRNTILWSKEDVLEEGEELTKDAKTYRFYVNTRRNPEIYDKYGGEMESQFKEFFSKANKQQLLIAFYEGRLRRFYIGYVNTGFYNDPDGYWDDPVDIDEKGRDFLHKHVSQEDLVHMLNVYIRNYGKGFNDKYKSSKRQSRIYKYLFKKHWNNMENMPTFTGFNDIMEGMAAILLNRYKDFVVSTSMIEVSTLPTHS